LAPKLGSHCPPTRLFSLAPNATASGTMGPIEDTTAAQADALGNDHYDIVLPAASASAANAAGSVHARRVAATPHSLSECGDRLRAGDLVSFPTETVYGLGCHALDPEAVSKVFRAKERPLSDPLIVHVTNTADAMKLWDASSPTASPNDPSPERRALHALCDAFWPGPLTIVAKAAPSVPGIVMAGTGYVACRSPSHPVARALIDAAQVPIAAPSANKFGHVSPTRADHVLDDLGAEDVWVVDPAMDSSSGGEESGATRSETVCDVGVESTVAKVEMASEHSGKVVVLRHGAVSTTDIRRALDKLGLAEQFEVVAVVQSTGDHVAHVAPGQTIRHYSPDVVSYMIAHSRYGQGMELGQEETTFLSQAVVIDFAGRLGALKDYALAYRDLSSEGDSAEAAAKVFDALRWAEDVQGAERVYFPELVVSQSGDGKMAAGVGEEDALTLAVKDRLTRAASGVVVDTLQ
jgi:L-threonylcarbamoyladenylate synthase